MAKYGVGMLGAGWVAGEYVKVFRDHPLTELCRHLQHDAREGDALHAGPTAWTPASTPPTTRFFEDGSSRARGSLK